MALLAWMLEDKLLQKLGFAKPQKKKNMTNAITKVTDHNGQYLHSPRKIASGDSEIKPGFFLHCTENTYQATTV